MALLVGGCTSTPSTSTGTQDAVYRGALPATFGGGDEREARVTLTSGGDAAVQGTFHEPPSRYFAMGRWKADGDRIVVDLQGPPPQRLVFVRSGQQLTPREWDRAVWGEKGPPVLYRLIRPTIVQ
jgi:hypothetical protein